MVLVRDDCLVPTKDAPELGYVRESSEKQYVPDVFYKVSFLLWYIFLDGENLEEIGGVKLNEKSKFLFISFYFQFSTKSNFFGNSFFYK